MYQQQPQYNPGNAYPPYYNPNYPQQPQHVQTQRSLSQGYVQGQQQYPAAQGQQQYPAAQGQQQYSAPQGQQQYPAASPYQAPSNNNSFSSDNVIKVLLIVNLLLLVHTILPQGSLIVPNAINRYKKYDQASIDPFSRRQFRNRDDRPRPHVIPPFSLTAFLWQCHYHEVLSPSFRGGILITTYNAMAVPLVVELPSLLTNLASLYVSIMFLLTLLDGGTSQSQSQRSFYSRAYMYINFANIGVIIKLFYIFYAWFNDITDFGLMFAWWFIALGWCLLNGAVAMSYSKSLNPGQGPMSQMQMQGQLMSMPGGGSSPVMTIMGNEQQRSNGSSRPEMGMGMAMGGN